MHAFVTIWNILFAMCFSVESDHPLERMLTACRVSAAHHFSRDFEAFFLLAAKTCYAVVYQSTSIIVCCMTPKQQYCHYYHQRCVCVQRKDRNTKTQKLTKDDTT